VKKPPPQCLSSCPKVISKNIWDVGEQRAIQKAVGVHLEKDRSVGTGMKNYSSVEHQVGHVDPEGSGHSAAR
jgi:hypothetical protein